MGRSRGRAIYFGYLFHFVPHNSQKQSALPLFRALFWSEKAPGPNGTSIRVDDLTQVEYRQPVAPTSVCDRPLCKRLSCRELRPPRPWVEVPFAPGPFFPVAVRRTVCNHCPAPNRFHLANFPFCLQSDNGRLY